MASAGANCGTPRSSRSTRSAPLTRDRIDELLNAEAVLERREEARTAFAPKHSLDVAEHVRKRTRMAAGALIKSNRSERVLFGCATEQRVGVWQYQRPLVAEGLDPQAQTVMHRPTPGHREQRAACEFTRDRDPIVRGHLTEPHSPTVLRVRLRGERGRR